MFESDVKPSQNFKLQKVISPSEDLENYPEVAGHQIREPYLAIFVSSGLNEVYLINLHSVARFPICIPLDELCDSIDRNELELSDIEFDPRVTLPEDQLSDGYKRRVGQREKDIKILIQDLEATLRNGYKDGIFQKAISKSGRSRQYIYDTYYSYLRNGCRLQGLGLPQGKEANRIPKTRNITVKQGSPNIRIPRGKVLNEYDYKAFEFGKRLYSRKGMNINKSLEFIWRKYYFLSRSKKTPMEKMRTGEKYTIELYPPHERPSYNQYHYWLLNQYDGCLPKRDKNKYNRTEYDSNLAGRPGDAYLHVKAPGECYVLDETPFDEELVSEFDPTRSTKIGKATVYFVRDMFTRPIVGVYITTQNPSYGTIKEALFCSARDKSEFFEEMEIPVDPELWPMSGVPQAIFVDNAEFRNHLSEGPIMDLPINVKFARAGRGDDKPLGETIFNVFSKVMQGISPAHQTKFQKDIALQLARKNACLTMRELYYIAIVYIIHYNNSHLIKDYPRTREMKRDGVKSIPAELWKWGCVYRPSGFVQISDSELYLKLLECGEVSVHKNGLTLSKEGLRYNCDWTLSEGLQDRRPNGNRALKFPCRYFRGLVDIIFISTKEGLKRADLDARDQRFKGMSFEEVRKEKKLEGKENALIEEASLESRSFLYGFVEDTVKSAMSQKSKGAVPSIKKIKENRVFESALDRVSQQYRFLNATREHFGIGSSEIQPFEPNLAENIDEGLSESHNELDAFNQ